MGKRKVESSNISDFWIRVLHLRGPSHIGNFEFGEIWRGRPAGRELMGRRLWAFKNFDFEALRDNPAGFSYRCRPCASGGCITI